MPSLNSTCDPRFLTHGLHLSVHRINKNQNQPLVIDSTAYIHVYATTDLFQICMNIIVHYEAKYTRAHELKTNMVPLSHNT
jgi:hypothetical protein